LLLKALLYIAVKSRPEILFAVNETSRICENPVEADNKKFNEHFNNIWTVQKR